MKISKKYWLALTTVVSSFYNMGLHGMPVKIDASKVREESRALAIVSSTVASVSAVENQREQTSVENTAARRAIMRSKLEILLRNVGELEKQLKNMDNQLDEQSISATSRIGTARNTRRRAGKKLSRMQRQVRDIRGSLEESAVAVAKARREFQAITHNH